jgi:archaemetzincin
MPSPQPPGRLCIVSLGESSESAEQRALTAVQSCFGLSCEILPPEPEPGFALDTSPEQHNALLILDWLERRFSCSEDWILAVTNVDLSIPVLTFVFGEGRLGGRSAVVSTFRLREEFYGRPADRVVFLSRLEKEAIHEVGHMLGLTHCLDRNCAMYASTSLIHTDVKSPRLCPNCHCCLPQWCQTAPSGSGGPGV